MSSGTQAPRWSEGRKHPWVATCPVELNKLWNKISMQVYKTCLGILKRSIRGGLGQPVICFVPELGPSA